MKCLLFLFLGVGLSIATANILPQSVSVVPGEGFIARLDMSHEGVLQNCQLTRNSRLYMLVGKSEPIRLSTGEIVSPFDYNSTQECGIRVRNVQQESAGTWRLTSMDENGNEVSGRLTVNVLSQPLQCPQEDSDDCSLVDTLTDYKEKCSRRELWKNNAHMRCDFLTSGQMTQVSLLNKGNSIDYKKPWVTESGSRILECLYKGSRGLSQCSIEHERTGRVFNIEEGLLDSRYSAYKTSISGGLCQFELPVGNPEMDAGIWKMVFKSNLYHEYDYSTGQHNPLFDTATCHFRVTGDLDKERERLNDTLASPIVVKTTEENVKIHCAKDLFYPLNYCYLTGNKKGRIEFFDDDAELQRGNCHFVVGPGEWTCGFDGEGYEEDREQRVVVKQYKRRIIEENVTRTKEGTTAMECHYIEQKPLYMCMLVSPSGKVFRPTRTLFQGDDFSFFEDAGEMEKGDCGVEFAEDVAVEEGEWRCIIQDYGGVRLTTTLTYKGEGEPPKALEDEAEVEVVTDNAVDQ